ncbi:MAG: hypothetical protein OEY79_05215 [Anaplasmataceae bacterium]|nr:hypothetical protein [Anaplasmataceae bacterium]
MKQNKNQKKAEGNKLNLSLALYVLFGLLGLWTFMIMPFSSTGQIVYNQTAILNTTLNITNSAPLIYAVSIDPSIDLIADSNKTVFCNVTVFDFDNDTLVVNASFYLENISQPDGTPDGNNLYKNSTCTRVSEQANEMNYTCSFPVLYYADNSTNWKCNITVSDGGAVGASNITEYTTINPLVAIKVPGILNYGNLVTGQISDPAWANITNSGNRNASIAVEGYAVTPGDGLSFNCTFGNILLANERYNATAPATAYSQMTPITSTSTNISGFYVGHRTSEVSESINSTYWRVQVPIGAGGVCNGKILFTASDTLT